MVAKVLFSIPPSFSMCTIVKHYGYIMSSQSCLFTLYLLITSVSVIDGSYEKF